VWSPSSEPTDLRSDATSHGGFDEDSATMTSVLLRILGTTTVRPGNEYVPNLLAGTSAAAVTEDATEIEDQPPEVVTAEVHESTATPHLPAAAQMPKQSRARSGVRHADAEGTGSRVIDAMVRDGWKVSQPR
jgi:hypothetical protein